MCSLSTVCFSSYVPSHVHPLTYTHTCTCHTCSSFVLLCSVLFTSCLLIECLSPMPYICPHCTYTHHSACCASHAPQCLLCITCTTVPVVHHMHHSACCTSHAPQCLLYMLHLSTHTMLHVRSVLHVIFVIYISTCTCFTPTYMYTCYLLFVTYQKTKTNSLVQAFRKCFACAW